LARHSDRTLDTLELPDLVQAIVTGNIQYHLSLAWVVKQLSAFPEPKRNWQIGVTQLD